MQICSLVLMVLLTLQRSSMSSGHDTNFCADCSSWIEPNCSIQSSGMALSKLEDLVKLEKVIDPIEPIAVLRECVANKYNLIGELKGFICFMSKKRGCLLVGNRNAINDRRSLRNVCKNCAYICDCLRSAGSLNRIHRFVNIYLLWRTLCVYLYFSIE